METKKEALVIGERVQLFSEILGENRDLNIYLPYNYSQDTLKTYPIIYLLDGSMDEDFIHIAGLVQFGSFSWIDMLPESIVVGIGNVDRKRDFTYPSNYKKDLEDLPTSGHSSEFIQFLGEELQPFMERNYRNATTKTIIGQSLGGLVATEILFKKPNLFDNYIIVSPSLWWDEESLLKNEWKNPISGKNIFVGVGKEGPIMERIARELFEKLNAITSEKNKIHFNYYEAQNHGDALHLAVYDAFEKIFKPEKPEPKN